MEKTLFNRKHLTVAIALVLMLAMAVPYLPSALGVTFKPNARISYAFAAGSPNPAFKDSTVFFVGWVYPPPSVSGALFGDFSFTVTKPDGTKVTRTAPSNTQASAAFGMVVDQIGNWTLHFSFAGDLVTLDRLPAESNDYVIQVISGTFTQPEYTKIPDYLWSNPISSVNQEWFRISGEWGKDRGNGYSNYNAYSTGPVTSHILWKQPGLYNEGLLGGSRGHYDVTRSHSDTLLPSNPVAWNNMLYYSYLGSAGNVQGVNGKSESYPYSSTNNTLDGPTSQARHVRCVDMNTGDTIWDIMLPYINYTSGQAVAAARTGGGTLQIVLSSGPKGGGTAQDYNYHPPGSNSLGCKSLWVSGGGLWKIDAVKGDLIWYQLTPALSPIYDSLTHCWFINNYPVQGNLTCIDATEDQPAGWPADQLDPIYAIFNGQNVTAFAGTRVWTVRTADLFGGTGFTMNAVLEGYVVNLITNSTLGSAIIRLKTLDAYTGKEVANGVFPNTPEPGNWLSSGSNPCYGSGVYSVLCADGITRAWSFKTGSLAWASPQMDLPWGVFGAYQGSAGNGLVMGESYAPYMYAYNATTGAQMWKQTTSVLPDGTPNPYNYEYAENGPPTWGVPVIATNAVYYATSEHTPANPNQRGDALYANALDGTLLWRLPYFKGNRNFYFAGIACEKMWMSNEYDSAGYMFGKGPTQTTISIPLSTITEGGSTIIQGRITDISAGTKDKVIASRYPDGVPAVSDDRVSMDTWMAYLYVIGVEGPEVNMTNVKGVTVALTATGSDGSVINIGTAQANKDGFYSTMWTPPNKNVVYNVRATFRGNNAYFSSYADAAVGVTAAPSLAPIVTPTPTSTMAPTPSPIITPTVAPTPTPTTPAGPGGIPASTMYAIAAAIVVIVIVAVAAVALRRRK